MPLCVCVCSVYMHEYTSEKLGQPTACLYRTRNYKCRQILMCVYGHPVHGVHANMYTWGLGTRLPSRSSKEKIVTSLWVYLGIVLQYTPQAYTALTNTEPPSAIYSWIKKVYRNYWNNCVQLLWLHQPPLEHAGTRGGILICSDIHVDDREGMHG